jgi:hypothetical protein
MLEAERRFEESRRRSEERDDRHVEKDWLPHHDTLHDAPVGCPSRETYGTLRSVPMNTPAARRSSLADAGWLLAALAIVFAGLWRFGWRLRVLIAPWSDAQAYFLPKYQYAADRIAGGELPLWNPYEFGGIPFLATIQPAVFYPPARLVMAALSNDDAHLALFGFHLLVGALGSLWLARELGLSRSGAVLAALWVTQPSWLLRAFDNPAFIAGVAWVPYLLVLSRRAVFRPSARTVAFLALAAAMQVTSGYPPLVLATAYLVALGVLAALVEMRPLAASRLAHALGALGGAGIVAALLVAAQLVPTVELIAETNRHAEATLFQEMMAGLDPQVGQLLNIPAPDVRGALDETWRRYGPTLVGFIVLGLVLGWARPVTWFATIAVVLVTCVPLPAYRHLPLFSFVRLGLEWMYVAPFVVYLAAAIGFDAARRLVPTPRVVAAAAALCTAGAAAAWGWHHVPAEPLPVTTLAPLPVPAWERDLCELDDVRYRSYWPKGQEHGALFAARIASIGGYEQSLLPARSAELLHIAGAGNATPRIPRWANQLASGRMVTARMGLRCVLAASAPALAASGFRVVINPAGGRVYVDPTALPRARLAYAAHWVTGDVETMALLRGTAPSMVILDGPSQPPPPACTPGADDDATLVADRPEDVRIDVTTSCPAHLVLADSWFPGWTATIDGIPTTILRADYAFRAVAVPAGRHEVRFVYAPRSVAIGLALSLVGLVVTLCLLVVPTRP